MLGVENDSIVSGGSHFYWIIINNNKGLCSESISYLMEFEEYFSRLKLAPHLLSILMDRISVITHAGRRVEATRARAPVKSL